MIKIFRNFRLQLFGNNKVTKYLLYATGEIILVVIGILIALQINNNNDKRKERIKEVHYLENIKTDLQINIAELKKYIEIREKCLNSAGIILEHFNGKPVEDYTEFNSHCINIYSWKKFYQNNNTFQELTNSGNLAMISNDSIKTMLLNLESSYKIMKSEEDHFRFDTETLIYEPLYGLMDLEPLVDNFEYNISGGKIGRDVTLNKEMYNDYFKNTKLKNGFVMTILEFNTLNNMFKEMVELSNHLIESISVEINKSQS